MQVRVARGDDWLPTVAADDPWHNERPADLSCPATSVLAEYGATELRTSDCGYITVQTTVAPEVSSWQSSPAGGVCVVVQLAHGAMNGPAGQKGQASIAIGGEQVWQQPIALDAPTAILDPKICVDSLAPGTKIHVNVNNHGANAYALFDVIARFDVGCP